MKEDLKQWRIVEKIIGCPPGNDKVKELRYFILACPETVNYKTRVEYYRQAVILLNKHLRRPKPQETEV